MMIKETYSVAANDMSVAGDVSARIKRQMKSLGVPSSIMRRVSVCTYEAEINLVIHSMGGGVDFGISDEEIVVTGDMTIKGVTKEITVTLDWTGPVTDPQGSDRLGFETSFSINRQDYGVSFSAPLEAGGVLVGDKVNIELDIAAVKAA